MKIMHPYRWLGGAVIVLLVIIDIIALVRLTQVQGRINQLQNAQKGATDKFAVSKDNMVARSALEIKNTMKAVNPNIPLVSAVRKDTLTLQQLVGTMPKLVFRYSELNCMSCVDHLIPKIKKIAQVIGKKNIIIAATYHSIRDLYLFKRLNGVKMPVYKLPTSGFGLPIGKVNLPFLFVIDPQFQTKLLFVPDKTLPVMSQQYCSIIESRIFNIKTAQ
jgi:hypothetical protein